MMNEISSKLHLALPLFHIFLLYSNGVTGTDPQTQHLIDRICLQTEDYWWCNATFNSNLAGQNSDMEGLAEVALQQSIESDTDSLVFARSLSHQTPSKPLQDYLAMCIDGYLEILEPFVSASIVLSERNYGDLVGLLRETPTTFDAKCGSFSAGSKNPLGERNREMGILITMSQYTADALNSA